MKKSDISIIKGIAEGEWIWCLHCERCYKAGEFRIVKQKRTKVELQMCPYPDCDGDTVFDSWNWEHIRRIHPHYPEEPERDKIYPLYS